MKQEGHAAAYDSVLLKDLMCEEEKFWKASEQKEEESKGEIKEEIN
jgi:hypothetical protein